ncbi:LCP family protein [Paucisalibacillus globulus]|uniref:LCP family protein n=1 Tax=Paucisalibacillus globulus TaxID=351095 RepID=UPI000421DF80|nr:LCP family protein [Paucisalibacillus globulus]
MSKNNSPQSRMVKRTKRRKLRKRVFFISIPLIFFVAVGIYVGTIYLKADQVLSDSYVDDGREKSDLREKIVNPIDDSVSVLIMGVDASNIRANENNSRTDTLMVATLNPDDKSVKLVSIPRDTLVYIPEVGYEDKINHAHAYGGTEATINTVENLLEIPIDYYVKVNFEAFIDVVDAVNGITIDVPYEFSEQDSNDVAGAIHLLPGIQDLNGEEALALARTRKLDNDIERGKRQQEIIKAIVKKSISVGSILKVDDIIEAVGTNMTTNMSFNEMKGFISYGTKGTNLDIEALTLEGYDYKPGKVYYWKLDDLQLAETKQALQNHLDINTSTVTNQTNSLESASQY